MTEIVEQLLEEIHSDGSDSGSDSGGEVEEAVFRGEEITAHLDLVDIHNTLTGATMNEDVEMLVTWMVREFNGILFIQKILQKNFVKMFVL